MHERCEVPREMERTARRVVEPAGRIGRDRTHRTDEPGLAWLLVTTALILWAALLVAAVVGTALVRADGEPARWLSVPGCICGWVALIMYGLGYAMGRGARP